MHSGIRIPALVVGIHVAVQSMPCLDSSVYVPEYLLDQYRVLFRFLITHCFAHSNVHCPIIAVTAFLAPCLGCDFSSYRD
jgi:hypothetical protein